MWKEKLCLIIISISFFLTGCQKEKENMTSTLKINFQEGDLPSLHPHDLIIFLRGISLAKTLFEGLTRIDAHGKAQLAGAESVDISADGLQYIFHLKENHWSDGTPVTASQYEKAWKEVLSPKSTCQRADLLYMIKNGQEAKKGEKSLDSVGVKAIDTKTLQVELTFPSPHFLELLAQPICVPLINPSDKEQKQFNGPFQVSKWDRNLQITLAPNPHFWNKKSVFLKQIEVMMVSDYLTAFSLYEKRKLDWIGVPLCALTTEQIARLKKQQAILSQPIARAFWLFLNTSHTSLSSPLIRNALSLAIDRKAITDHILIGGSPLQKALPYSLLPTSPSSPIQENLQEAKLLFQKGLQELKMTADQFPPLVITYSPHANRKQLAEYLQQTWSKAFGVEVELQGQEWNVLRNNWTNGLFEISGGFEASYYKDPLELLERFTHLNSGNFPQWVHRTFGEKVFLAMKEQNVEKRNRFLGEAEQILIDQMPFIPICSDSFLFSHSEKLKGYTFDSLGAIDFSYCSN